MAKLYWLFTGVLFFLVLHESSGLRCYECKNCNDNFNASLANIETCYGRCAKTKRDNSGYVVRFCTPNYPDSDCTWTKSTRGDHDIGFCACDTDLCNSATVLNHKIYYPVYLCLTILLYAVYH